jgi:hypothetical protein
VRKKRKEKLTETKCLPLMKTEKESLIEKERIFSRYIEYVEESGIMEIERFISSFVMVKTACEEPLL